MSVEIPPGGEFEATWILGEAAGESQATAWIDRFVAPERVQEALDQTVQFWRHTVSAIQVESPAPEIDLMANGWLVYQNMSCRLWGRSAFYQPGGAYGFRDQLQDAAALVLQRPDLTRRQILRHASQQFVEGDVLHWWHPDSGYGLRTRFSDDLLWLPYVTATYVRTTGDDTVLEERVPFVQERELSVDEQEAYLRPHATEEVGDVYEHCCRAGPWTDGGRARASAHRKRRLERWHESGWHRRREKVSGSVSSSVTSWKACCLSAGKGRTWSEPTATRPIAIVSRRH